MLFYLSMFIELTTLKLTILYISYIYMYIYQTTPLTVL